MNRANTGNEMPGPASEEYRKRAAMTTAAKPVRKASPLPLFFFSY